MLFFITMVGWRLYEAKEKYEEENEVRFVKNQNLTKKWLIFGA